eukprot:CAMPEP_0113894928 /NCGR_PEP_ID=MMETSP0780_2-20120614/17040_1 /TAXON_ID=652834 /ORGANISM="Palpitomonas bilix" /LENGTH=377 /DNA_ID=CAMNT_0000885623 /DNA_START=195 /DNA_END=1325 /DNA_ORIENTATION=- /assembly_acc=CAM_ASM_000599
MAESGAATSKADYYSRELLSTELAYSKRLSAIYGLLYLPLLAQCEDEGGFVTKEDIDCIFRNLESIQKVHETVLDALEEAQSQGRLSEMVPFIFSKFAPYFKEYERYTPYQETARKKVDALLESSEEFRNFLAAVSEKLNSVFTNNDNNIQSMLMEPSQRPTRILMTLTEVLKGIEKTAEKENDAEQLETLRTTLQSTRDAVAALHTLNTDINERMKEVERTERLIDIQNAIIGGERKVLLVEAHRRYIREGEFEVCTSEKGNEIEFQVVHLFNDLLLFTQPRFTHLKLGLEFKKKIDLLSDSVAVEGPVLVRNCAPSVKLTFQVGRKNRCLYLICGWPAPNAAAHQEQEEVTGWKTAKDWTVAIRTAVSLVKRVSW